MFIEKAIELLLFCKRNLIFILILFSISNGFASEDVRILESSQRGVTVQINPVVDIFDTIKVNAEDHLRFLVRNAAQTGEPGAPLIPVRFVKIGRAHV